MQFFSSGSMGCGWSEMVNLTAVTTELRANDEPATDQYSINQYLYTSQ